MPVWPFNEVSTQDAYRDATTAQFPNGRTAFSVQVYGAGVYYTLIRFRPPNHYYTDPTEHALGPLFASFNDPKKEGLEPGELFGGIMFRSSLAGSPAVVTVI